MNKNYFTDKNALDTPWIESPFFYALLENDKNLSKEKKEMCIKYHESGYLIVDLELKDEEINPIIDDMYKALDDENTKYHANHFTYNDSKRIFEHWKESKNIADLTVHPKILETLSFLYDREPFPFSTINFIKGSNQPLHSDVIHFHTVPYLWMVGVWIALEDVDESNGSLKIIPSSHKWPIYEYHNLNLPHPDEIENGEATNYKKYENFLLDLVEMKKADTLIVKLKKGQALIWAANMLHGGCNVEGITDFSKTRLTQANHYFFEGCAKHYHPMFSRPLEGKYASKWCSDENNIKTYLKKEFGYEF
jgi:ectoine hydroxylase-related dioxygenase (phytanoyl-CoA dioxygenase family)